MPSPIGHVLAGLAIGLAAEAPAEAGAHDRLARPFGISWLTMAAAFVAAAPDLDLVLHLGHRTLTHSVTATIVIMSITAAVTGQVTGRIGWRTVLILGAAHASHLFTDWLGADPFVPQGLQVFWPFSDRFYISDLNLFPMTERNFAKPLDFVISVNVWAAFVELVLLAPFVWLAARVRRREALDV